MIIYLNGASSSGKSSIAYKLQEIINKPIIYFSIDTLLYSFSEKTLQAIQGKRKLENEIDWNAIFKGYFDCIASLSKASNYVICDCPVYLEIQNIFFKDALNSIDNKFIVGIECSLDELKRREVERGDRKIGLAEMQFNKVHSYIKYDFLVDSDKSSPRELANSIKTRLAPFFSN